MSKYVFAVLIVGFAIGLSPAGAQASAPEQKKAVKKTASKSKSKAAQEDAAPSGMVATDYTCEQGKKVTIYRHPNGQEHPMMRWNKRMHKMTRVETESGAERLESKGEGLTWIAVPVKAMLLDAKKGQAVANDCKKPGQ